jgi:hypothetical protein
LPTQIQTVSTGDLRGLYSQPGRAQKNQAFQACLLILADMAEQVVELFHAPASAGCCCHGAAKVPALRQRT